MRIKLISDVHVEVHEDEGRKFVDSLQPELSDVLVIAGDFGSEPERTPALRRLCARYAPQPIIFVAGNHDYWWETRASSDAKIETIAAKFPNFHPLENSHFTVVGPDEASQRFVGCTLWYRDPGDRSWSDFGAIEGFAGWLDEAAQTSARYLDETLQPTDIVVTHMLPSYKCVAPKWEGTRTNVYFVHEIDDILERRTPKAHLFGHTHNWMDVKVGHTRCICRPLGHSYERFVARFDPTEILEL